MNEETKVEKTEEELKREKEANINNSEAFTRQVYAYLKQLDDYIGGLTKKDCERFLRYALIYPYHNEEILKKFQSPRQKEIVAYIDRLITAKNNSIITTIAEYGDELRKEQMKEAEEAAKCQNEDCDCEGNCDPCQCEEKDETAE